MKEVLKYSNCFVCGDKNQGGLKAKFWYDNNEAFCELTATAEFEGYKGIYHGGVLSAVLDEVMIKAILAEKIFAVTAEMTIRFIKPTKIGDQLRFTGHVTKRKGRIFFTEGKVTRPPDEVIATATGKYIEASKELKEVLVQSGD